MLFFSGYSEDFIFGLQYLTVMCLAWFYSSLFWLAFAKLIRFINLFFLTKWETSSHFSFKCFFLLLSILSLYVLSVRYIFDTDPYAWVSVNFFFFNCSGFCHTLKWISHGFTCVPHPDPPSHLPFHPIPLGLPGAPGPSACLMHPTWAGDLFHPR